MAGAANISRIESWLHGKLLGAVSSRVYAGTLPSTLGGDWADMALIDVADSKPLTEFGRGVSQATVNVYAFARPMSTGEKPVGALDRMETAIRDIVDNDSDPRYSMSEMYARQGYMSDIGYHYVIIAIRILIS